MKKYKSKNNTKEFLRSGEITTILTVGSLIVLAAVSLVSSVFLGKERKTSISRAQAQTPPSSSCQGSCSIPNSYCTVCASPKTSAGCKADQGVTLVYQCEQSKWVYKYPECQSACKPETEVLPTNPPAAGCFYLSDEIYYNPGQGFDHWVKFWSPQGGGDGHITLKRNGADTGLYSAWNKGVNNPFAVPPDWSGHNLPAGSYNFVGSADHCPGGIEYASLTCQTQLVDGKPSVAGERCIAKNFVSAPPPAGLTATSAPGATITSPAGTATVQPTPTAVVFPTPEVAGMLRGKIILSGGPGDFKLGAGPNDYWAKIFIKQGNNNYVPIIDKQTSPEWQWDQAEFNQTYTVKVELRKGNSLLAAIEVKDVKAELGQFANVTFSYVPPSSTPSPTPIFTPTPAPVPNEKKINPELIFEQNACGLKFCGAVVSVDNKEFIVYPSIIIKADSSSAGNIFVIKEQLSVKKQGVVQTYDLNFEINATFSENCLPSSLVRYLAQAKLSYNYQTSPDNFVWQGRSTIACIPLTLTPTITPIVSITPTPTPTSFSAVEIKMTDIKGGDIIIKKGQRIRWINDLPMGGGARDRVKIFLNDVQVESIDPRNSRISTPISQNTPYKIEYCNLGPFIWVECLEYSKGYIIVYD